jgi:hypothetical protein
MRTNGTITSDATGYCIGIQNGNKFQGAMLTMQSCNGQWYQKWNRSGFNSTQKHALYRQVGNSYYCMDTWNPYNDKQAYMWWCDTNADNHVWETWWDNRGGYVWRQLGSNYCLNAYNPVNGKKAVTYRCDNSDDQVWDWNGTRLIRKGSGSNNQCLNHYQLSNGSKLDTWRCSTSDPDQQFSLLYLGD